MKQHHIFSLLAIIFFLISTVITNGGVFIALLLAAGAATWEAVDNYQSEQKIKLPECTIIYTYTRQGD